MHFKHWRRIVVTLSLSVVALSSGCSGSTPSSPADDFHSTYNSQSKAPDFSGPHSELFREIWDKAPEKKLRDIMRDELISDLEWSEVTQDFSQCIAAHGMEVTEVTLGGGSAVSYINTPPESGNIAIQNCQRSSGLTAIGILHSEQITNPNNEDIDELMSACLVRAKVVSPSYTSDDWRRESARPPTGPGYELDYVVPKESGDVAVAACSNDPTHSYQ